MAIIDFPNSPTVGQQFTPANGVTYEWNGTFWYVISGIGGGGGGPFLPIAGGTMGGELTVAASTTGSSGFKIPQGSAPTTPADGDMWTTSTGLFVRVNGVTVGPLSAGGGAPTGSAGGDLSGTYPNPALAWISRSGAQTLNIGAGGTLGSNAFNSTAYLPLGGGTLTGKLTTIASAVGAAGFNLPAGSPPTSPVNGDIWTTTAGVFARINGVTVGPFASGGGAPSGPAGGDLAGTYPNPTLAWISRVAGKTLTLSNSLTFAGTDGSTLNIGTGGTLGSNAFNSTAYAPLASPAFTGAPTAPTAALRTNNNQLATTAFVLANMAQAPYYDVVTQGGIDNTGTTDVTAAFNALWASHPVLAARGNFKVSGAGIIIPDRCTLVGAGTGNTVFTSTNPSGAVVSFAAFGIHMRAQDFTVTHSGVTPVAGGDGFVFGDTSLSGSIGESIARNIYSHDNWNGFYFQPTDNSLGEWLWAENNYNDGFHMPGVVGSVCAMQYTLTNSLSEFNNGWGVYFAAPNGCLNMIQGSPWFDFNTYANGAGGMAFIATGTGVINDIALYGVVCSNNGMGSGETDNIVVSTNGGNNNVIQGGLVELAGGIAGGIGRNAAFGGSNKGVGLNIGSPINDLVVSGVVFSANAYDGIATNSGSILASFSGNTMKFNGQAAAGTYRGIVLNQAGAVVTLHGNIMPDDGQQFSGIAAVAGTTLILHGNVITGTSSGTALTSAGTVLPAGSGQNHNIGVGMP